MWGIREKWRGWQFFFFFFLVRPVLNQPSSVKDSRVSSGLFQYSLKTDGPRTRSSPSLPARPGRTWGRATHEENQVETGGSMNLSATPQFQEDDARSTECDATVPSRTGRLFHRNTFIWTAALTRTSVLYLDNQNPPRASQMFAS